VHAHIAEVQRYNISSKNERFISNLIIIAAKVVKKSQTSKKSCICEKKNVTLRQICKNMKRIYLLMGLLVVLSSSLLAQTPNAAYLEYIEKY
jgi:hypothetical protein